VLLAGLAVLPLAPGFADEPKPTPAVVPASADEPPAPPAVAPPAARWRGGDDRVWVADAGVGWTAQNTPAAYYVDDAGRARLKDEVELLEAQMNVKKAHLTAAERGVKSATGAYDRIKKLAGQGTVSQEEVAKAEEGVEKAMSEIDIRKAELQEHMVRLKQAMRRLNEGTPTAQNRPADAKPWVARDPAVPERYPSTPPAATPAPRERNPDLVRPGTAPARNADPAVRPSPPARPPTADSEAANRATLEKRMRDMMDQYERTQRDIEKMQKQQADIKKMLDDLAAEHKRLGGDQPTPSRRGP
jgi:septal ring factor EnvC (AmiA/AmiB activator)